MDDFLYCCSFKYQLNLTATKCFSLPFPSSGSSNSSFQSTPGLPITKHLKCIMFKTRQIQFPSYSHGLLPSMCPSIKDHLFQARAELGMTCLTKYWSDLQTLLICLIFMSTDDQNGLPCPSSLLVPLSPFLCSSSSLFKNQILLPPSRPRSFWFWRQWRTQSKWNLEFKVTHHCDSNHIPFRASFLTTSSTTGAVQPHRTSF